MNIRLATPSDWQKFRDIRLDGMKTDPQAFGGDLTEEINRNESGWRERLGSDSRFYYVAEEGDIFISVAGAIDNNDGTWMLMAVYTRQEFRGKGLGQKVVQNVIDELKNRKIDTVELLVNIDQKDAVSIYKKIGFEIIETIKDKKMADGNNHDEYFMSKKIL